MTALQKYFGFGVSLTDNLDPLRVEVLADKAAYICNLYEYDPDQFHVYFHLLTIRNLKNSHFGFTGLESRLKYLSAGFTVNQKQIRNQKIRFFNYLIDNVDNKDIVSFPSPLSLRYQINSDFFNQTNLFRNEIITFISRDLPSKHRKIKVTLIPVPTREFKSALRQEKLFSSKLDFRFQRAITLSAPRFSSGNKISTEEKNAIEREAIVNKYYTFNAPVHNVGDGFNVNISDVNAMSLIKELEDLIKLGRDTDQLSESEAQIVEGAVVSLRENPNKLPKALLGIGRKLIDISEKISCNIIAAVIKSELGI